MNKNIRFITYGKGFSILLIVIIHFYTAFFNANEAWSYIVRTPLLKDTTYPKCVILLMNVFGDCIFGFLVVGAVCFFFLSAGFTVISSLKKRNFKDFWKNKFFRLVPFYIIVFMFNMIIAYISSNIWNVPFKHTYKDILFQLCLGLQYIIPNIIVLDNVIWFLGVLMIFYFMASVIIRKNVTLSRILLFDIICIIFIIILKCNLDILTEYFTLLNIGFLIKSLSFCIYISIGITVGLNYYKKINLTKMIIICIIEYIMFALVYRYNIEIIGYLGNNEYFIWFSFYVCIFLLLYLLNEYISYNKSLEKLGKISFSLYFCHGYIGYFIVFFCINKLNLSKGISALIALIIVLKVSDLLNKYIEIKIAKFLK